MRRALLIEIRRSSLRWCVPVFTCFQLAMLFGKSEQWEYAWSETSAAITVATGISVPLIAAAAAWEGTRWHRSGDVSVFHHHTRFAGAGYVLQLLATLCLVTVPFVVTTVAAWISAAAVSGPGLLWPGYLLFALAVQWAAAGLGLAAGRIVASRLVVPAVAMTFMVPLILLPGGHPFALFSLFGGASMVLLPQAVAARVLIAVAALVLGLAAIGRHRDVSVGAWRGWTIMAASATAIVIAVQIMASGGPILTPRAADGIDPLCTDTEIEICVWPDQAGFLPELTQYAHRLEELSSFAEVPARYTADGLDSADDDATFSLASATGSWMRVTDLAFWIDVNEYPEQCDPDAELDTETWNREGDQLAVWYSYWIFGGPPPPGNGGGIPYDREAMAELIAQPVEAQFAWAQATRERVLSARPCGEWD
ncbi:hypothetical protein FB566_3184 [Stackebrandtia endophytica]|uniref:Uncharacterized protein n=1 Tax=Stackebrandtia endophytica TaxID=1496996 RepID=A0A543AYG2_9ACTN|nr:hypothetical protein [Stackebrandtia endophytica]TQL77624.1 hypothetical protein FB566_3184 [Stackebrandtia endophytica]